MGGCHANMSTVTTVLAFLVSFASLVVSIHTAQGNREQAKRQSRALALELFLLAFAMRDKDAEAYAECQSRCARLYAHLAANGGEVRTSKYIATTACAAFFKRDTANQDERLSFEKLAMKSKRTFATLRTLGQLQRPV